MWPFAKKLYHGWISTMTSSNEISWKLPPPRAGCVPDRFHSPQISNIFFNFVLWEAVSQTNYCYSQSKYLSPKKIWGWLRRCIKIPTLQLMRITIIFRSNDLISTGTSCESDWLGKLTFCLTSVQIWNKLLYNAQFVNGRFLVSSVLKPTEIRKRKSIPNRNKTTNLNFITILLISYSCNCIASLTYLCGEATSIRWSLITIYGIVWFHASPQPGGQPGNYPCQNFNSQSISLRKCQLVAALVPSEWFWTCFSVVTCSLLAVDVYCCC